ELAVVVAHRPVAGAEPPVAGEGAGGGLGIVPVAGEHVGAADPDLARVAREHVAAVGVDEAHVDTRKRRGGPPPRRAPAPRPPGAPGGPPPPSASTRRTSTPGSGGPIHPAVGSRRPITDVVTIGAASVRP